VRPLNGRARARPNPRLVKIHRNYTIEEVANLFGIYKGTVCNWLARGLPICDDRRPILILGQDLVEFLNSRRAKPTRRCAPGEMFCLRCRVPRKAAGDVAGYVPHTATVGNLTAACVECGCQMFRRVNRLKLEAVFGDLRVRMPQAQEDINDNRSPSLNGDLNP